MRSRVLGVAVSLCAAFLAAPAASTQAPAPNPEREAYFGETHVHTGWSFDAFIFGNTKTTPADAYRYATGETIKHAAGYDIKIETPLDWMGVTDTPSTSAWSRWRTRRAPRSRNFPSPGSSW